MTTAPKRAGVYCHRDNRAWERLGIVSLERDGHWYTQLGERIEDEDILLSIEENGPLSPVAVISEEEWYGSE